MPELSYCHLIKVGGAFKAEDSVRGKWHEPTRCDVACRELPKANNSSEDQQNRQSGPKGAEPLNKRKLTGANPFAKKAKPQ